MRRSSQRDVFGYIDGSLGGVKTRALQDLMRHDEGLRRDVESMNALVDGLRRLDPYEPAVDLVALAEGRREQSRPARGRWLPWSIAAATTGIAIVAVVALWAVPIPPDQPEGTPARWVATVVEGEVVASEEAVAMGDVASAGQVFATEAGARLVLSLSGGASVTMTESSRLRVVDPDPAHSSVLVESGGASAALVGAALPLEIRMRGSTLWLQLRSGAVDVQHDASGRIAVESRGAVFVRGGEESVEVTAGRRVIIAGAVFNWSDPLQEIDTVIERPHETKRPAGAPAKPKPSKRAPPVETQWQWESP